MSEVQFSMQLPVTFQFPILAQIVDGACVGGHDSPTISSARVIRGFSFEIKKTKVGTGRKDNRVPQLALKTTKTLLKRVLSCM